MAIESNDKNGIGHETPPKLLMNRGITPLAQKKMEQYLNPQSIEDYNKKEFWEDAFQKYKANYDWYGKYDDFQTYFAKYIKKSDRILMVGCGNSTLGEKLLQFVYSGYA